MYCSKCGENNPEEAKFCKNCGATLKKEEVKKAEVIEAPRTNQNRNDTYQSTTTTSGSSNSYKSTWIGCCLCLIGIFIIFAIIGSF